MALELTILGANSAIPTVSKSPTSQVLSVNQSLYLIDCGEGTQVQMRRYKIKIQRIGEIFISHMHGDHYFGLIGLLNSMSLLGRTKPLKIFGPPVLKEIINIQLKAADTRLSYPWEFVELDFGEFKLIHRDKFVEVYSIPLDHRIPCNGFLFKETEGKRRIIKKRVERYGVPIEQMSAIKDGADFIDEKGNAVPNEKLTEPPKKAYSYAYCSDTRYNEKIIPVLKGVDILYHEATFIKKETERAVKTFHSTAEQAATVAKKAGVKKLIIGHYSARYSHPRDHVAEARKVFPDTEGAREGDRFFSKELDYTS